MLFGHEEVDKSWHAKTPEQETGKGYEISESLVQALPANNLEVHFHATVSIVDFAVEHLHKVLGQNRVDKEQNDDEGGEELGVELRLHVLVLSHLRVSVHDGVPSTEGADSGHDRHSEPHKQLYVGDSDLILVRSEYHKGASGHGVKHAIEGNHGREEVGETVEGLQKVLDELRPLHVKHHHNHEHLHVVQQDLNEHRMSHVLSSSA